MSISTAPSCEVIIDLKGNIRYIVPAVAVLALAAVYFLPLKSGPAAVVNGEPISRADFEQAVAAREQSHRESGTPVDLDLVRNAVLEQMITERLLIQGAREAGIKVTDSEVNERVEMVIERHGQEAFDSFLMEKGIDRAAYTKRMRARMLKDRFVEEVILENSVTEEQMREHYRNSPAPFVSPETVEARLVEFSTFEAASNAIAEMRTKGFDPVADWIKRTKDAFVTDYETMDPEHYTGPLGKAMRELGSGEFGGPYKGRDGFFLLMVRSRQSERPKTFEEAREEIKDTLVKRDRSKAILRWVTLKLDSSRIKRNI